MSAQKQRNPWLVVLVAALGYFVDIYDLLLFSIVRKESLESLGLGERAVLEEGLFLISAQMTGLVIGGVLWGVLGDKRGRLSVLFGSIFLYSVANVANGFVHDVQTYAVLRFVAGIGLAGELGAGITLVSELLDEKRRGIGTAIVAAVGICGAVVAAVVGDTFEWRTAYFVGGGLGVSLLLLRVGVFESGMFERTRDQAGVVRGSFVALLGDRSRLLRYVCVILVGVPIWYVVGILVTFSPEIGGSLGMDPKPDAGRGILFTYVGLAIGDLASGLVSQWMRSRKRVLLVFIGLTVVGIALYFTVAPQSLALFYAVCVFLGIATGYWAVFVTVAAEQFGTNLRATATTTTPNFVRGAVTPMAHAFKGLHGVLGVWGAALALGVLVIAIALLALRPLPETFGKNLDYLE